MNKELNLEIVCEEERYLPAYANETDACMDLKVKIKTPSGTDIITPNETMVFGTGIKVKIPEGYVMLIFPRSSTGIKLHCMLSNTTGVIDAGYRDEIRMAVTNFGDEAIELTDAQRLAQFMIIPRPAINLICVEDNEKFRENDRGGGIGSTNYNKEGMRVL